MAETFQFSPRPNRAAQIPWRSWGREVFEEARLADRPVLLVLTAAWSRACHQADETTFSDPRLIELLSGPVLPLRVDADRHPHVQERYIAGGWPTMAFLAPSGEVLWVGVAVEADELVELGTSVLEAWRERREELGLEIERRRKALDAARGRPPSAGLVRREAADDVITAARATFDERNGGFGGGPKFPSWSVIELLYAEAAGDPAMGEMADRTLDGMLAGTILDREAGGFFRYAVAPDWTDPRHEKLLETQATAVRAFALGASVRNREDWRAIVTETIAWVDRALGRADGLWSASMVPGDEGEFTAPDPRRFAGPNARWIAALAHAGARLGEDAWIARAATSLERLLTDFGTPDDLVRHGDAEDEAMPRLLADAVACARAALLVGHATGRPEHLAHAGRLAAAIETAFWADDGGFLDRTAGSHDVGLLHYRDRTFEPNAEAARLLLDLVMATGTRSYRARAERTLAILSPVAGRYGVEAADFALGVHEFFDPPVSIVVVGDAAAAAPLRRAALALPRPELRVLTATNGQRIGTLQFNSDREPAAFACGPRGRSGPVSDPEELSGAVSGVA